MGNMNPNSKSRRRFWTYVFVVVLTVQGLFNLFFVGHDAADRGDAKLHLNIYSPSRAGGKRLEDRMSVPFKVHSRVEELYSFFGSQIYEKEFVTLAPCNHVLEEKYTRSLENAKSLCVSSAACVCLSRNIFTGHTHLCASSSSLQGKLTGKMLSIVFRPWENVVFGGCNNLHDERVPVFHSVSDAKSECRSIGLDMFEFTDPHESLQCFPRWQGKTASIQEACWRCLSTTSCGVVLRWRSGVTIFCNNETNSQTGEVRDGLNFSADDDKGVIVGFRRNQDKIEMFRTLGNADCHAEQLLMDGVITHSFQHAALLCRAEPHCTVFTRNVISGTSRFCQGYGKLLTSGAQQPTEIGFKQGCELYSGEPTFAEAAANIVPTCAPRPFRCPGSLFRVPKVSSAGFDMPSHIVCDECFPNGLCPVLQSQSSPFMSSFTSRMNVVSEMLMEPKGMFAGIGLILQPLLGTRTSDRLTRQRGVYRPINPSIYQHNSKFYVVFRITNAIRCEGVSKDSNWECDFNLRRYQSHVAVCRLSKMTFYPLHSSCFRISDPVEHSVINLNKKIHMFAKHTSFFGPEDPRGFSFRGSMYILSNVGIELKPRSKEWKRRYRHGVLVRRMLLYRLNGRRPEGMIILNFSGNALADDKNVVPVVDEGSDRLFLVFSIFPYKVCAVNLSDGSCEFADQSYLNARPIQHSHENADTETDELKALGKWRGSTPFMHTPFGYIGAIHRKQDLELGRLYTHKWILLGSEYPHFPIWMSRPFRFPGNLLAKSNDIQFASGLLFDSATNTAIVTYGSSDCLSMIGNFSLDEDLKHANLTGGLQAVRAHKTNHAGSSSGKIRWEGPVSDQSGYASAARVILNGFIDRQMDVYIRNVHTLSKRYESTRKYEAIYNRIIKSQDDMPVYVDVTIRFHWPPNFDKVPDGKLVVYLPWEYYHIPETWVARINSNVDELWTTCMYAKRGMISSGVREDKVFVIPHGVDQSSCLRPDRILQDGADRGKPFRILYHGGILLRKGIDLLLQAYSEAFRPTDDVFLLIHGVYGDDNVKRLVSQHLKSHRRTSKAKVEWIKDILTEDEITLLYETSDLLVHPSRSEGFGLGIVEAMSFGLPVLVPAAEPMTDFVNNRNGYLIPATEEVCNSPPCFNNGTVFQSGDWQIPDQLRWFQFDHVELAGKLREIFDDRETLLSKRHIARRDVCKFWSWAKAKDLIFVRISTILKTTVRL